MYIGGSIVFGLLALVCFYLRQTYEFKEELNVIIAVATAIFTVIFIFYLVSACGVGSLEGC